MSDHPVVLALFEGAASASDAARTLRGQGIPPARVSIVARSHDEEGIVARAAGASPGSELEDSAPASRLGELGAHLLAAIALVMPGIGPIVVDGPLAAGLGEAAGHLAGGIGRMLERAGLAADDAREWEAQIRSGAFLVGVHVATREDVRKVQDVLVRAGSGRVAIGTWQD